MWVLYTCRLVAWTLRLRHTLPMKPGMQMKSLKRSMYARSHPVSQAFYCSRIAVAELGTYGGLIPPWLSACLLSGLRDTCRLMIRKIQFAPVNNKPGPKAEITKQFMMSDKPVHLEASIEKEVHWILRAVLLGFFFFNFKYNYCLMFHNKFLLNSDLLPRRSNRCQGQNQQRDHQGREENQSLFTILFMKEDQLQVQLQLNFWEKDTFLNQSCALAIKSW